MAKVIPIQKIVDALLDTKELFPPRYLYRLSDLEGEDLDKIKEIWPSIPLWRRQALMEDVETLGEKDTVLSFETLCQFALQDADPKVRLLACRGLWEYENPQFIPTFIKIVKSDQDMEVRAAVASGLGQFVYAGELEDISSESLHRIEETLLKVINGSDTSEVRRRALESLGYSGREEIPGLIKQAFESGEQDWVESALFAMGRSADERWHPQVLQMLASKKPSLRSEAARAAGELEIHEAVPVLLDLLDDADEGARLTSMWALSQLGGEGVREELEKRYNHADDDDEMDYLASVLDNLTFTEEMQLYPLFNLEDLEDDEVDEGGIEDDVDGDLDLLDEEDLED